MTEESAPRGSDVAIPPINNLVDVDVLLVDVIKRRKIKDQALESEAALVAALAELRALIVDPIDEYEAAVFSAIGKFLADNKTALRAKHGKTISLMNGDIMWRLSSRVELPKDVGPIVRFFLRRRNGRKFLIVKYAISKKALASFADRRLLRTLRQNFRVWVGDVEHTSLKIVDTEESICLAEEHLPRRMPRVTK